MAKHYTKEERARTDTALKFYSLTQGNNGK